jgi:hypothetical protein
MIPEIKELTEVASNVATVAVASAGAWWFFFRRDFRRRIQFEIDLKIFPFNEMLTGFPAEASLVLENKGQIEHRAYNLFFEARFPSYLFNEQERREPIVPLTNLVPEDLGFYFIAPGVRQAFTTTFVIPRDATYCRILGGFTYRRKRLQLEKGMRFRDLGAKRFLTHTGSRLFQVSPSVPEDGRDGIGASV